MKNNKSEPIPVMDYRQYRRVRRLVHECCNYIDGNCIALDDGEKCVCVQSISYSLLCRWFRTAVLPQDKELETALFHRMNAKKCAVCGALFTPGSNRAKYCPECAARMKRINAAKRISDFERGFIRAQVIAYKDLEDADFNYAAVKAKGLQRTEGKEYVVNDGDVIEFLFNV